MPLAYLFVTWRLFTLGALSIKPLSGSATHFERFRGDARQRFLERQRPNHVFVEIGETFKLTSADVEQIKKVSCDKPGLVLFVPFASPFVIGLPFCTYTGVLLAGLIATLPL